MKRTAWATAALVVAAIGALAQTRKAPARIEVSWRTTAQGADAKGIEPLSGGDGVTRFVTVGGSRALTVQSGTTPRSQYLYFRSTRQPASPPAGPLYLVAEYYDGAIGTALACQYDSTRGSSLQDHYVGAEDQAGGFTSGSGRWRTAIFRLERPRFGRGQNLGADFRLEGGGLTVRAVRLTATRPGNWAQVARVEVADVKPLVKIGPGGQLIVGGFDPARITDAAPQSRALESAVPALQQLGVTSHEGYVRWNLCEPQPGKFDFSVYDRFVEVYKRHHLKWVPFLIVGSPYSLPDWYYKKPGAQGYVCLEHNQESDVQSLWNPALREHVSRFIKAFCDHYRDQGVIESILLGVTGNYGEAIYPASGNDWTADIHGQYHTHAGFWANDRYAVESFRIWLIEKYGGTTPLRDAWGEKVSNITTVTPFLRGQAPNKRAWLDMMDWYIGSMTRWARFWLEETRRDFPRGDIYLCTGGDATPEHGSDFGEQCKAAAAAGAGVRITNEASDYRGNFSLTRWVASAGRQYDAYFSFEPASSVSPQGVVSRIYNATASGARGLHYYFPNLFETDASRQAFVKYGGEFRQRKPIVEIGVYYPETYIRLNGQDFLRYAQPLRDRFDYDFVSDGQIRDGALNKVKALILLHGNVAETATWRAIAQWVRQGGVLLYPEGMGKLQTVEGDDEWHNALFGAGAAVGKGRAVSLLATGDSKEFRDFVTRTLATAPELSAGTRAMVVADGQDDNVFATLCEPNELLWLNFTPQPAKRNGLDIPAYGIASQEVGR